MNMFIYFDDLTEDAQDKYLQSLGVTTPFELDVDIDAEVKPAIGQMFDMKVVSDV